MQAVLDSLFVERDPSHRLEVRWGYLSPAHSETESPSQSSNSMEIWYEVAGGKMLVIVHNCLNSQVFFLCLCFFFILFTLPHQVHFSRERRKKGRLLEKIIQSSKSSRFFFPNTVHSLVVALLYFRGNLLDLWSIWSNRFLTEQCSVLHNIISVIFDTLNQTGPHRRLVAATSDIKQLLCKPAVI